MKLKPIVNPDGDYDTLSVTLRRIPMDDRPVIGNRLNANLVLTYESRGQMDDESAMRMAKVIQKAWPTTMLLYQMEWSGPDLSCPVCRNKWESNSLHKEDCYLAYLLNFVAQETIADTEGT